MCIKCIQRDYPDKEVDFIDTYRELTMEDIKTKTTLTEQVEAEFGKGYLPFIVDFKLFGVYKVL